MITVGVLFGGRSGEHEVSRCSAASVVKCLDRKKYDVIAIGIDKDGRWYVQDEPEIIDDPSFGRVLSIHKTGNWFVNHYERGGKLFLTDADSGREITVDVVFPVVHGTFCEDGTLQGLLELAMVPYVGADVAGSAIGMDKDAAKRLLRDSGIPVVPWKMYKKTEWLESSENILEEIIGDIGFPCFIKPCNTGSSVGIEKVKGEDRLRSAIDNSFQWDNTILVEQGINAREIEFSVLGNEKPEVSVPGEIRPKHEFYSYEAKYLDSQGAELIIPAEIDEKLSLTMRDAARAAYLTLNCSGMARIDFFLDRESDNFFLNEINTLPGFTSISMYPKLWDQTGLKYPDLLDRLIELAFDRKQKKESIRTEFDGN